MKGEQKMLLRYILLGMLFETLLIILIVFLVKVSKSYKLRYVRIDYESVTQGKSLKSEDSTSTNSQSTTFPSQQIDYKRVSIFVFNENGCTNFEIKVTRTRSTLL